MELGLEIKPIEQQEIKNKLKFKKGAYVSLLFKFLIIVLLPYIFLSFHQLLIVLNLLQQLLP